MRALVVAGILAGGTVAHAQPSLTPVIAEPERGDPGVREDANAGRAWFAPTALADPAGSWWVTSSEILVLSVGYAFTDEFSISATVLPPVLDGDGVGLLSAKYQLLRTGRVRLAAHAAAVIGMGFEGEDGPQRDYLGAELGGVATVCLDAACRSSATGFVGTLFDNEERTPVIFAASVIAALTSRVKVVLELDRFAMLEGLDDANTHGIFMWYGMRFTSPDTALDVGFVRMWGSDEPTVLGLPFVGITYRGM